MSTANYKLVWIDLETGGLNGPLKSGELGCSYYPILEVAVILTDPVTLEYTEDDILHLYVRLSKEEIELMDTWCLETHTKSGLVEQCLLSLFSLNEVEEIVIAFLQQHEIYHYSKKDNKPFGILAGNSIAFDRSFIMTQMPQLHSFLSYQMVDVTAIQKGMQFTRPEKEYQHEALADIKESIAELKHYRKFVGISG